METLINELKKAASTSNERAARNINNLIGRIESFEREGNAEKLNECKAEAELWLAA